MDVGNHLPKLCPSPEVCILWTFVKFLSEGKQAKVQVKCQVAETINGRASASENAFVIFVLSPSVAAALSASERCVKIITDESPGETGLCLTPSSLSVSYPSNPKQGVIYSIFFFF